MRWLPYNCNEYNSHVVIGREDYFLSADGYLMPVRKDQRSGSEISSIASPGAAGIENARRAGS